MLKKIIRQKLEAMGKELRYDFSYISDILDADLGAFMSVMKFRGISDYRRQVPLDAWYAVKLTGAMHEDCGPCSQLMVTMAERAGVAPETLRAVASHDDAALSDEVLLAVEYARAVLTRDPEISALRDRVVERWGQRGLISLAFGLVSARFYPTLKYALGHGSACARLEVGGQPLAVRPRHASALVA
jgi:hypothetical protein